MCWLALLLIRIIEITTGDTWTNTTRRDAQRLQLGVFTGPGGSYRQTTEPTQAQRRLRTKLDIPTPPRILHLDYVP